MVDENNVDDVPHCEDSCACDADADPEIKRVPVIGNDTDDETPKVVSDEPSTMTTLDECEDKLKRTMADYENMMRQKDHDIALRSALRVDSVMTDILQVHDDIERAHEAFTGSQDDASGLAGILKNVNALLAKHNVTEVDALGKHFDPEKHESVAVVDDDSIDDGTVTKVIRKGYICQDRILRPSLVEISRRISK